MQLEPGDIVRDTVLNDEGAVGEIYNNYYEMLTALQTNEEELRNLGYLFTEKEKKELFYLLYVVDNNAVSCHSRLKLIHRPSIKELYE